MHELRDDEVVRGGLTGFQVVPIPEEAVSARHKIITQVVTYQ